MFSGFWYAGISMSQISDQTIILETLIGSRLYGTFHKNSDYDVLRVIKNTKTGQSIVGIKDSNGVIRIEDVITLSLNDFLQGIESGTHQCLEALHSPIKTVLHPAYAPMLSNIHPNLANMVQTYVGAITQMGRRHKPQPYHLVDHKTRSHILRLAYQLHDVFINLPAGSTRFNPVLTPKRLAIIQSALWYDQNDFEHLVRTICPVELPEIFSPN